MTSVASSCANQVRIVSCSCVETASSSLPAFAPLPCLHAASVEKKRVGEVWGYREASKACYAPNCAQPQLKW
eukprot:2730469-Amphidinium_carterae.1